ncbi:Uncharacterised protein [Clostridioides difficile]|nr:Uncharacterised protein [Clostridioides difficile]
MEEIKQEIIEVIKKLDIHNDKRSLLMIKNYIISFLKK